MIKFFIYKVKQQKVLLKILSSSFLAIPISILVSFVTFRFIEPYYLGIWATVTILETYATFFRAGIINGMNRELPFALGKGEKEKAMVYAQTTFAYTIFTAVVLLVLSPIILVNLKLSSIYLAAISVGLVQVLLNQYSSFLSGTYRTSDNFNKLSNIQFIMIGVKLLCIPLIYFFAFKGYLMMQLVQIIIYTILLHIHRPFHLKPKFQITALIKLFKIGFPVFLSSYAIGFVDTLPRIFILNFGSTTLLGIYAPIITMLGVFSTLPSTLGSYFYPRLTFELGKNNNPTSMYKTIIKIYLISLSMLIPLVILVYYTLDYFILFFPKYQSSLPYLEISLFIAPFVIAKLGNLISIILKQVDFMSYYVVFYGCIQFFSLALLYIFISKDVLYCAIWSQIITFVSLLAVSLFLNYLAVKSYSLQIKNA